VNITPKGARSALPLRGPDNSCIISHPVERQSNPRRDYKACYSLQRCVRSRTPFRSPRLPDKIVGVNQYYRTVTSGGLLKHIPTPAFQLSARAEVLAHSRGFKRGRCCHLDTFCIAVSTLIQPESRGKLETKHRESTTVAILSDCLTLFSEASLNWSRFSCADRARAKLAIDPPPRTRLP
jgi:hypothetical protein